MQAGDIILFLEAIDEALVAHAGPAERLDLQLLGRSSLIVSYGLALATRDVDVVSHTETPRLEKIAFDLFGKGTVNPISGLYLEAVPPGLPPVAGGARRRAKELPGNWKVLRPLLLEPHDFAVTKLKRFHAGDREDLRIMCDLGELTPEGLTHALDLAYPFGMDVDEDPGCRRAIESLRRVVAYLEGQTNNL